MKTWKKEKELQRDFTAWMRSPRSQDFRDWIRWTGGVGAAAFELKLVKRAEQVPQGIERMFGARARSGRKHTRVAPRGVPRLAFSAVAGHQIEALRRARGLGAEGEDCGAGLSYKISDSAIGYKPFDCFWLGGVVAGVVIGYGEGCGAEVEGTAYFVPIEEMEGMKGEGGGGLVPGGWAWEAIRGAGWPVLV